MVNAVIYCRVSSDLQVQNGAGLDGQEIACRQYAQAKGWNVVQVFKEEGVSGGLLERPALLSLYQFVALHNAKNPNKILYFLCDDIDRIARDIVVHMQIKQELERLGLSFVTVKMTFDNTATGRFSEGIMALQAEFFRRQNAERVFSRQHARMMDGYWPRTPPLGYQHIKSPNGGKVIVFKEPEASLVKEGLEAYASDKIQTIRQLKDFWNSQGLLSQQCISKKAKSGISLNATSNILNQLAYTGHIHYQKTSKNKFGTSRTRNIPFRKARHEALISLETYQKIQEKLHQKRPNIVPAGLSEDFPLKGFLTDEDGNCLLAGWSKGRNQLYPYYRFSSTSAHKDKSMNAETVHGRLR
ncbi:Site-specific DNA recombinase, partial [Flexibacter flexilis DSM 6793]